MTDAEIVLFMVKSVPIILAVWIFVHLLNDEYYRALESHGLVPPRSTNARPRPKVEQDEDKGEDKGKGKDKESSK